ncbi:MAG: alanyl-tRNA editing protein [Anaerolineae bacterium]|nr:alanyl-tRNA editing protein [Anaerolineae bacterium]
MTRLYYTDSYTVTFDAAIIEQTTYEDAPAVVLDQTFFYPTSGGQPHDAGTLNDVPVIDVVVREADHAVLHVLKEALPDGEQVTGAIDWARRFDHMQHHTGQHILSQAFIQIADAATIGFHLSPDSVTIDLNQAEITAEHVVQAEALANRIVTENRPVYSLYPPTEQQLAELNLRKVPDVAGTLRVVDISGFDATACGGTHVAHTGEIGLIKVLKTERRGDTTRVEFRCGGRAFSDYQEKHALLNDVATDLTTGYDQIPAIVAKLREENKAQARELRTLRALALAHEAETLWQNADHEPDYTLITQVFADREMGEIRNLIQKLVAHPKTIVLCGTPGEKALMITACSDDLKLDMVEVLMNGLAVWGIERGGGRPTFAQGGGVKANAGQVETALQAAAIMVRNTL